jgi:hypothetical protein
MILDYRGTKVLASLGAAIIIVLLLAGHSPDISAGTFALTGEQGNPSDPDQDVDFITYPIGYSGAPGLVTITVGINPDSPNAAEMVISLKNAIRTWNSLEPTHGNIDSTNVPIDKHDFESVCLHELGHALGLDHVNLTIGSSATNFTNSIPGPNPGDTPDLDDGADNFQGSSDDVRGDDINRNWFRKGVNNPFTIAPIVDSTTYSRNVADLPDTLPSQTFFNGISGDNISLDFRETEDIVTGDVDHDGDQDVIAGDQFFPVRLYLNNGTTDPFDAVMGSDIGPSDTGTVMATALGDLDLDGDLDLVVGRDNDPNLIYLNNGTAAPFSGVSGLSIVAESHVTTAIVLGDIDGDNDLDVVEGISQTRNRAYLNNGDGTFAAGIPIGDLSEAGDTTSLALGDIDKDGDLDLVVGNFNQLNRFHRNTAGTFEPGLDIGTETDATFCVVLADLNRDGRLDVVVGNNGVNRFYKSSVLPNPFSGVTALNITNDDNNTRGIAAADVNFDGVPDVIAGNTSGEINRLYINDAINNPTDPFGSVSGTNLTNDAADTRAIVIADVDNDGDRDVVAANRGTRNRLYLNNGPVHNFIANANSGVSSLLLPVSTEAVMTAGSTPGESVRSLGHDDVATTRYGLTGLDELAGTSDDFAFRLTYAGMTVSADIVVEFNNTPLEPFERGLTVPQFLPFSDHYRLTSAQIFFRDDSNWFFNPTLDNAIVFANFAHEGIEDGSDDFPFNTVAEALAEVADGGAIIFSPGASPETPTINQNVTLMASGASATIGLIGARSASRDPGSRLDLKISPPSNTRKTGFVARPR